MDNQAIVLNSILEKQNKSLLEMLSDKGKNIFFPKMGILSQSAQAKGKSINATIGEAIEDNNTSMHLPGFDSLINIPVSSTFPYAPSFGKPELRDKWKEFIVRKNPSLKDILISKPIATNGITHGISIAAYLFAQESDSVIISDLYWENYDLIFENGFGASIETFKLFEKGGFNAGAFAKKIESAKNEKIILLLNFPNNPSGYTPLTSEIDGIVSVIEKAAKSGKKLVVIIDDAYFGLVYEENVYRESIFANLAALHENVLAIKLDGATKEDYVWGFRVGFITYGIKGASPELYEALENKTGGAIRGNISNISHLSQSLLLQVYQADDYEGQKLKKYTILKSRYELLKKTLLDTKYSQFFEPLPFNSGYFMCVKVKEGIDAEKIRLHLLAQYDTGVIVFGDIIRLAFSAVPLSKIPDLVENIYKACNDLK